MSRKPKNPPMTDLAFGEDLLNFLIERASEEPKFAQMLQVGLEDVTENRVTVVENTKSRNGIRELGVVVKTHDPRPVSIQADSDAGLDMYCPCPEGVPLSTCRHQVAALIYWAGATTGKPEEVAARIKETLKG